MTEKPAKQTANSSRRLTTDAQTVANLERHLTAKPDASVRAQTPANLESALAQSPRPEPQNPAPQAPAASSDVAPASPQPAPDAGKRLDC